MAALYVISAERVVGKTAICAGIGKVLTGKGKKIGFFKPLFGEKPADSTDNDAAFLKQALALPDSIESISPFLGTDGTNSNKIKEAYSRVAQGKDLVLIEGILGQGPEDDLTKASYEVASVLNARVIVVEGYSSQLPASIDSYKGFGEDLLGIILNKVPQSQLKRVNDEIASAGTNILGVFPEDRVLSTVTVGEIVDCIQGKVLNNTEKSVELIENLMMGAMVVDSGLVYFGRKNNKAVIVRSDRPDMQLAALETSTRCLILSNNAASPIDGVLQKAEIKGIPIISTEQDICAIVTCIEGTLGKARFNQEKKLPFITAVIEQYLNLDSVNKELNLAG